MLGQQLRAWEVLDDRVLRVLRETPREKFAPPEYRDLAFADTEIPIGFGQAMLAPKIEGRILQALEVEAIDTVLVVGTGTGFLTACLAHLSKQVRSLEIHAELAARPAVISLGTASATLNYAKRTRSLYEPARPSTRLR